MLTRIIPISLLSISLLFGSSPAKPGVIASDKVQEYTRIMAADYAQGGLVTRMQSVRAANIALAESGSRDLREDVYMSFPVILGSYADRDDLDTVRTMLQQELFDGPWESVTMAEHYEEMSYGQFHLSGTVYGWYEMSNRGEFYEGSQSEPYDNGFSGPPGGVGEFLQEALDLADQEIDFTLYDSDGPDGVANSGDDDGFVDAAFFAHSGSGGEGGGPYIWSHRWTYSGWWGTAYTTNDTGANGQPVKVNDYIMQPAVSTNSGLIEIGVFSHEFGHALGLPDLYDTDYTSNGVGSWCLMASGSWSTPASPTHFSAWCKEMMGWIVPVFPNENLDSLEFPNAEQYPFAVKLWTHGNLDPYVGPYSHGQDVGQEYFLIENRQRLGTELHLPGTGLLIWHVDNSLYTNSDETHRMVDVMAADGHFNGSNSGDSWPGSTDNRNFDFETIPPAIGWAGVNTEVALLNISDSDSTMWADVEIHEVNPHIRIADMLISDSNGDQIYAPGEDVLIWLVVENSGGPANNLMATLSADGAPVEVLTETIGFDPIGFMQSGTSNLAFEFDIDTDVTPQAVIFNIAFTSDEILEPDTHELTLMLGFPELAIVDDDGDIAGAADYIEYYKSTLDMAEYVYAVWDVTEHGLPSSSWLAGNSKIIWYTGDRDNALDDERVDLISDYLDNGGKILMSGQDMTSDDLLIEGFLADYFAAEIFSYDVNSAYVYGHSEHEIMEASDRYNLSNGFGANNQTSPDGFQVLEGGSPLFIYPFSDNTPSAVSYKTESFSSMLLGFGLEALAGFDGEADSVRANLMNRMLNWLDLDYTGLDSEVSSIPETFGFLSAYPNPFNPQITINYGIVESSEISIIIYDLQGREVRELVRESQSAGRYSLTWDGFNNELEQVSTGVYFARIMSDISSDVLKMVYLR